MHGRVRACGNHGATIQSEAGTHRVTWDRVMGHKQRAKVDMKVVDQGEDGAIVFPLNQQHIADALGLSLVHTNRSLRRLQALGLHQIAAGRLRLLRVDALQRLAEYHALPLHSRPLI